MKPVRHRIKGAGETCHRLAMDCLAIAVAVCMLVPAGRAEAGAGVAGADILKIPVDARGWGMGMAYSAVGDDVGAIAYNPAGLSLSNMREVRLTGMTMIEDAFLFSAMISWPVGRWGTLGAMILNRSIPAIQNFNSLRFEGDVSSVRVRDRVLGGYIACRFSHLLPEVRWISPLSVGLGIKQVSMQISGFKTNATAVDLGLLLTLDTIRLALVGQNLGGGYTFAGTAEAEADSLPQTLRTAIAIVAYEDASNSLMLAIEDASYIGVASTQKFDDNGDGVFDRTTRARESLNVAGFGAEYWRLQKMGVRIGYVLPWGVGANTYTGGRGIAAGATFRMFTRAIAWQFDIAYRPISLGSDRQDTVIFSTSMRF